MAPKRGSSYSSDYSDSGFNGCRACSESFYLYNGDSWTDSFPPAFIAFLVLGLVGMLVGLIGLTRARWQKDGKSDKLRSILFPFAIIALIFFFLLEIADTALSTTAVSVKYLYYIVYVFQALFWRVADIIIAFTVYRTIREYLCVQQLQQPSSFPSQARSPMSAFDGPFRIISIVGISLLSVLTIASYGATIATYIRVMIHADDYYYFEDDAVDAALRLGFVYFLIYVLYSVFLLVFVGLKLKGKSRSLLSYILLAITILALFVGNLVSCIRNGTSAFDRSSFIKHRTTYNAVVMIGVICYAIIILMLTFLATDKVRFKGMGNASGFINNTTNGQYPVYFPNQAQQPAPQQNHQQQQTHMSQQYNASKQPTTFSQNKTSEMSSTPAPQNAYTPYSVSQQGAPQPQFTPSPPPDGQQHQYPVPPQPQLRPASPPSQTQQLYTSPPPQQPYTSHPPPPEQGEHGWTAPEMRY